MSCNNCQTNRMEQRMQNCPTNRMEQHMQNCPTHKAEQFMQNCQCLNNLPLAIAYVPWQKWKNVMCAKDGMEHGTIFADLVLPFHGCNQKFKR